VINCFFALPGSIETFIEDQVFSPSYIMIWLLSHPLSRQKVVSLSKASFVLPVELTDGRGGKSAKSIE
jgi:hypothetical protein